MMHTALKNPLSYYLIILVICGAALLMPPTMALARSGPARFAPEWDISEWINGPGVSLKELRGKVVIVEFFQLWCPGCNNFSIPLMHRWQKLFAQEIKEDKLVLVSIHTVFEGHDFQNPAKLKKFVQEKNITHLVGIDRRQPGERVPITMQKYRTGGTPAMAVIDQKGYIRFQHLGGFNPAPVETFIRKLIYE